MSEIAVNSYIEKMEFLPDDLEIAVAKSWCLYAITRLQILEEDVDLLHRLQHLVDINSIPREIPFSYVVYVPKYVTISVGDIKRVIEICGDRNLFCVFPYNYDEIADDFLCNKLGSIKLQIESLMMTDNIDEAIRLIDSVEDNYVKRLAFLYIKVIYSKNTENKIIDFKNSRKRTLNIINSKLY